MIRSTVIGRLGLLTGAAALLFVLLVSGAVAQRKVPVTGFFTNMEYIKEAGDVVGMEVWIVYARGEYWATVQVAEGEPNPPVVVSVRVSGQHVAFALKQPSFHPDGTSAPDVVLNFDGLVGKSTLTGTFGKQHITLKRSGTYWQ
jgi:hypothetical protein